MTLTQIVPLDRFNWELCLDIKLTEEQADFIPSVVYSLAQAKFEDLTPYGILYREKMVGFMMYGEFSGVCWLNRIMIDRDYQGQGIGSSALRELITQLKRKRSCREIRTSYSVSNSHADRFFQAHGFVASEPVSGEIVARLG
jgi:diamine N-acetyltransferase